MSERRPKIPHKTQLDIAFRDHGLCCLCFNAILGDEQRILEHKVPRAMFKNRADADKPENLGWAHKHCADLKTRGCTGTSKKGSVADGDTHKIAKAVRMEKERLGDPYLAAIAKRDGDALTLDESHLVTPQAGETRTVGGHVFERSHDNKFWMDRGKKKPKKRSGFRKDPNRVRTVGGKVRARKPRLNR